MNQARGCTTDGTEVFGFLLLTFTLKAHANRAESHFGNKDMYVKFSLVQNTAEGVSLDLRMVSVSVFATSSVGARYMRVARLRTIKV